MGLNWVEDMVSLLYRLRGYIVVENEDLQMPKTEDRSVAGHSDMDVIAIKGDKIKHVEVQSWWGPSLKDEERLFHRIKERFVHGKRLIKKKYSFLNDGKPEVEDIFVTSGRPRSGEGNGPWSRLSRFCNDENIRLVEKGNMMRAVVCALRKKYPKPNLVGNERGMARLLVDLIHGDFLKDEMIVVRECPSCVHRSDCDFA